MQQAEENSLEGDVDEKKERESRRKCRAVRVFTFQDDIRQNLPVNTLQLRMRAPFTGFRQLSRWIKGAAKCRSR